ncbi:hypothetical protein FS749_005796 [Ceratobasidium sp. UAMH 11750]|nr:hypothetical protein FS749_005796 [Ceratobasidium sp. UAMH 11750]
MQLRKEFSRPFFHEFILVCLNDGTQFRFDRRPSAEQPIDTLLHQGADAFDTVRTVEDIDDGSHPPSQCIIALDLKNRVAVSLILTICSAIQRDKRTCRYTLHEFNCYFFSWTIISHVARYLVAWEDLPETADIFPTWRKVLSGVFATRLSLELARLLPIPLSQRIPAVVAQFLVQLLPDNLLEISGGDGASYGELSAAARGSLSVRLLETELRPILAHQPKNIQAALTENSLQVVIGRELENLMASQGHRLESERRHYLGHAVRLQFWHDDTDFAIWSALRDMDREPVEPNSSRDTRWFLGGEAGWKLCADLITSALCQSTESSSSSAITQQVDRIVERILLQRNPQYASRWEEARPTTKPLIREIVAAAILEVTQSIVQGAVLQLKERTNIADFAMNLSLFATIRDLFPDTLPITLRIPPVSRNKVSE